VQPQAAGLDAGQPPSSQQPGQLGEGQWIAGRGGEWVGELVGVGGEQGEGDRFGGQVGGQGEQVQRDRCLLGEPVEGDLVAGGQRDRVGGGCSVGQQFCGALGEQGQVVVGGYAGFGQVGGGLAERQWQVAQCVGDPGGVVGGESWDAVQQGE